MSDEGPSKGDISVVFKKLRSSPSNKVCFDCGAKNPTWSSVTYGVFICIDCSAIHRGLGVHVSFVRSTQLDTNWTWLQMRAMQVGGNANATQFFRQHSCNSTDAQQKYKSRAAQLYKEKLHQLAVSAMRLHGYKLHIDNYHSDQVSPHSPSEKESDFFEEITKRNLTDMPRNESQTSMSDEAFITSHVHSVKVASDENEGDGPNVEPAFVGEIEKSSTKSTIGQRGATAKKISNMGGKKGLGAQRLNANFSNIEKEAESIERSSTQGDSFTIEANKSNEIGGISARLMVRDVDDKKREEQLKHSDPKKFEQSERLGMANKGNKSGISHSVVAEMKPIQQEGEKISGSNFDSVLKIRGADSNRISSNLEDDWEVLNMEPSKSSRDTRQRNDDFFDLSTADYNKQKDTSANWNSNASLFDKNRNKVVTNSSASTEEAVKKFGNAKAISSDQFFGDQSSDFQSRATFNRFEGQSAISSSEFFGSDGKGSTSAASGKSYNLNTPDVAEIKDSVRQGVTKVAGKLSQLSNSVSSYISTYNN